MTADDDNEEDGGKQSSPRILEARSPLTPLPEDLPDQPNELPQYQNENTDDIMDTRPDNEEEPTPSRIPPPVPSPRRTRSSTRKDKRARDEDPSDEDNNMGKGGTGATTANQGSKSSLKIVLKREKKPVTKRMKLWEYNEDTMGDGTVDNPIQIDFDPRTIWNLEETTVSTLLEMTGSVLNCSYSSLQRART